MNPTDARPWLAQVTGGSIILMAILAGVAMSQVFGPLLTASLPALDAPIPLAAATFRWGIVAWVAILALDLIVSWGVYQYYRSMHPQVAAGAGLLRLVYSGILAYAILLLWQAHGLLDSVSEAAQRAQWWELVFGFEATWSFGLLIFGVHLIALAYLVKARSWITKLLGILLLLAGIGYLVTHGVRYFIENYEAVQAQLEAIFMAPMILGELGWGIWLLVQGGGVHPRLKPG